MATTEQDWPWIKAQLEARGYCDLKRQSRDGVLEEISLRTSEKGPVRRLAGAGRTKEQAVIRIVDRVPFPSA